MRSGLPFSCLLLAACAAAQRPAAVRPLTLTHLGVAGWSLGDGARTILVDPYFSRPALDGPLVPDEAAIAARAPARADLVLVTHSHFDHLLDAPAVARRAGAALLGSLSTARYGRAAGLPAEAVIPIVGGEDYAFDGFSVRVLPGLHSALGGKHTSGAGQVIAEGAAPPLSAAQFGEGGTFDYLVRLGGREVLFIGSANFIERELAGLRPDVAVVATGLRGEIHDYTCRLMRLLGRPPLVVANHFDEWRQPLGTPLPADTRADLERFAEEVHRCAPATKVIVPEPSRPIPLP